MNKINNLDEKEWLIKREIWTISQMSLKANVTNPYYNWEFLIFLLNSLVARNLQAKINKCVSEVRTLTLDIV